MEQQYRDDKLYKVHKGESIKDMDNAKGLDRRPDVWVEDVVNHRVIKIIEVGRKDRQNQGRENKKEEQYFNLKIPYDFIPLED
jgi:hypothetical protein